MRKELKPCSKCGRTEEVELLDDGLEWEEAICVTLEG
jgi:hypothetical protein